MKKSLAGVGLGQNPAQSFLTRARALGFVGLPLMASAGVDSELPPVESSGGEFEQPVTKQRTDGSFSGSQSLPPPPVGVEGGGNLGGGVGSLSTAPSQSRNAAMPPAGGDGPFPEIEKTKQFQNAFLNR